MHLYQDQNSLILPSLCTLAENRAKFTFIRKLEKIHLIDFNPSFVVKKNSPLGFSLCLENGAIVVQVIAMTMYALTF